MRLFRYLGANMTDELKTGARNNTTDRQTIRAIRQAANQIVGHTMAMEPLDEDAPASTAQEIAEDDTSQMIDVNKSVVTFGGEIKATPVEGGLKLGGYLVRFSDASTPDVSSMKDYFDAETDYDVDAFPATSTVYFDHGLNPTVKARKLGKATLTQDAFGVFAETILKERDEYEKFILELAAAGKLGWSSGTAAHLVEREAQSNGTHHITRWPLGLDASLTHRPAEPRNTVLPMKSLLTVETEAEAAETAPDVNAESKTIVSNPIKHIEGKMEITEEMKALLATVAKEAVEEYRKSLPAKPDGSGVVVTKDEADQPWKSAGEFLSAVKMAGVAPSQEDRRLRPLKATGMSEGVPSDGGYLVHPQYATGILDRMYNVGQILSRVAQDPVAGNSMTFDAIDETSRVLGSRMGGLRGYWGAEAGTKTSSKPKFRQVELKLKKVYALVYATDEQLEDSAFLESWLGRKVPEELLFQAEDAIIEGDGVGKPLGILGCPALVSVLRTDAAKVQYQDVINMWARRFVGYNDYVWIVNQDVTPQLHAMATTYQMVYMPPGGLSVAPYATLFGRPVLESEYCQSMTTKGDIYLASLSQYQTITKGGIKSASSIHVSFLTDETAFRWVYRIDGTSLWSSALTPLHGSNTVSPFVCLATASV